MASAQMGETGKEMGERRVTCQAIIMIAQQRQDGHARVPQGERQLVERGPGRRGGPPQDQVADNRQKVGALCDNLVDQLAPCEGIRLAPELEARGGLEVADNGEPPALDVIVSLSNCRGGARRDPLRRCCTPRSTVPGSRRR